MWIFFLAIVLQAYPAGDPVNEGNFEVQAHTLNGMEGTQTLDDIGLGLLNHKDIGDCDQQSQKNDG